MTNEQKTYAQGQDPKDEVKKDIPAQQDKNMDDMDDQTPKEPIASK